MTQNSLKMALTEKLNGISVLVHCLGVNVCESLRCLALDGDGYAASITTYLKQALHEDKLTTSNNENNIQSLSPANARKIKLAQEVAWERLHTGRWDLVPTKFRESYGVATLLIVLQLVRNDGETLNLNPKIAYKYLDMILLMGGPRSHEIAHQFMEIIYQFLSENSDNDIHAPEQILPLTSTSSIHDNTNDSINRPTFSTPFNNSYTPIQRVDNVSLEEFKLKYMNLLHPVIITNGINHWPAYSESIDHGKRQWKNMSYLKRKAGQRTVPVEVVKDVGLNYLDDTFTQKLMNINQFIDSYIMTKREVYENENKEGLISNEDCNNFSWKPLDHSSSSSSSSSSSTSTPTAHSIKLGFGYLAQHRLFDQVPELRKDICLPDYCLLLRDDETSPHSPMSSSSSSSSSEFHPPGNVSHAGDGEVDEVSINAWFGPMGTVSPLHFDPKHNLLAQVFGSKYICLFPFEQSKFLYPYEGMMNNNSKIDFDQCIESLKKRRKGAHKENDVVDDDYPLFREAQGYECVLEEGEMLYIPPLWWHYVKSKSVSFSVSFWWGTKWNKTNPPTRIPSPLFDNQDIENVTKNMSNKITTKDDNDQPLGYNHLERVDAMKFENHEAPTRRKRRELALPPPVVG